MGLAASLAVEVEEKVQKLFIRASWDGALSVMTVRTPDRQ